ncbi:MGMT family protein [Halobaculum roseum]|uniref:MGMT family protein n=1 Tax=Halobaculum roseum TaxID=2175149 RepID=A0ABD5MJK0_9EURY|nr:MGMT family protein [Halobaculum roseum]QZY02400.1 MGMT family protein [Halobaculum roseum]
MTATIGGGPGDTGVFGRRFDAIDRAVELGTASGRLISVSFPETLPSDADGEHALLDRIGEYLAGTEDDFADVEVAITVPTDQRSVLESVRNVPYGESVDLARVAKMTAGLDHEDEADLQTAREALRANPIPIVVPDHRVRDVGGATPEAVAARLREIEGVRSF